MSIVPIDGGVDPTEVAIATDGSADRPEVSADRLLETRAEEAERRAAALETRVSDLERELADAVASCQAAERRRELDRSLIEAGTIDLDAAVLLAERELGQMDEPAVGTAIESLRRDRPYLFGGAVPRARPAGGGATTAPAVGQGGGAKRLGVLADEARESGDRRALLRYLRQRRGG